LIEIGNRPGLRERSTLIRHCPIGFRFASEVQAFYHPAIPTQAPQKYTRGDQIEQVETSVESEDGCQIGRAENRPDQGKPGDPSVDEPPESVHEPE
jgi:hypothetical protein